MEEDRPNTHRQPSAAQSWQSHAIMTSQDLQSIDNQNIDISMSNTPEIQWSDHVFETQFLSKVPRYQRPTFDIAVAHAKHFLNFYYTGIAPEGPLVDSILCLWFSMRVNGHPLIPDSMTGATMIPASPDSPMITTEPGYPFFLSQRDSPSVDDRTLESHYEYMGKNIVISEDFVTQTYVFMYEGLNNGELRGAIIHVCGFLAGTLCRLVTKEATSVERHIICLSKDRFNSVFSLPHGMSSFPPPNTGVYDKWETAFKRFSPHSNKLLAALVGAFKFAPMEGMGDVRGALKAMCLLSLGGIGLGALNWAQKASEAGRISLCTFLSRVAVVKYHDICQKIYSFLKYNNDKNDQVFLFCKLFHDGAFVSLSTKNQPEFSMTCAAIALNLEADSPLWNIKQFSSFRNYIENAVEFAQVYNKYYHLMEVTATKLTSAPVSSFAANYTNMVQKIRDEQNSKLLVQYQGLGIQDHHNNDSESSERERVVESF